MHSLSSVTILLVPPGGEAAVHRHHLHRFGAKRTNQRAAIFEEMRTVDCSATTTTTAAAVRRKTIAILLI
jgi:hypothetical protein